jgi:hypothetical protein
MSPTPRTGFFADRWYGRVPWSVLLWRDMLGVGTAINMVATALAIVAAIQDAALGVVALLHFAPAPYNFFLFAALWRMPGRPAIAAAIGLAWLVTIMVV